MTIDKIRKFNDQIIWNKVGSFVEKRSTLLIIGTLLITIGLLFPLMFMAPDEWASDNAEGEVFDYQETIEERFPPSYYSTFFIIESKEEDLLTQKVLWELYQNEEKLRNGDIGRYLYNSYDVESSQMIMGVFTIADMVQAWLQTGMGVGLENATDDQVKLSLHYIYSDPATMDLKNWLSPDATNETRNVLGMDIHYWMSKAMTFLVNADKDLVFTIFSEDLPDGSDEVTIREYFDRDLQETLRGDQKNFKIWGVAIDQGLEAMEEATLSFALIFVAVVLILIVVTVQFRSFKVSVLTLTGLLMLIIWLKGLSNLVGLNSSLTLDIIIPVAILVLGVDYVIHSMHRYHEEKEKIPQPKKALGAGISGVGGALFIAMLSTVLAFISNATSGIESIVGFGIAASMAIVSAFIILGLFIPAVKMRWDQFSYNRSNTKEKKEELVRKTSGDGNKFIGNAVMFLANKKIAVIIFVFLITVGSAYFAFQIEAKMDVNEFFDGESDFVVSLDKLDEHVGDKGGEPAIIYIEGDLTQPEALLAIKQFDENVQDNENVAIDQNDGSVQLVTGIFTFLDAVLDNPIALDRIQASNPGLNITDANNDGIPDTALMNKAIFDYMVVNGIPLNETADIYTPSRIAEEFYHDITGNKDDAVVLYMGITNTREQSTVTRSANEINDDMKAFEDVGSINDYGFTGSGYIREKNLVAITDSLSVSIIIAVALCFLLLVIALRSFKYAFITVIPEILVAIWLYAFMFLAGYHLNMITATIAAISIGVGIDYSVHITARFRQEFEKRGDKKEALEQTARHSGAALFGSAISTMAGFAIIGFAPMPMFSSFGILTAIMIVMALVAAMFVLPSLLLLVTPSKDPKD